MDEGLSFRLNSVMTFTLRVRETPQGLVVTVEDQYNEYLGLGPSSPNSMNNYLLPFFVPTLYKIHSKDFTSKIFSNFSPLFK